jgi:hypothetical protein
MPHKRKRGGEKKMKKDTKLGKDTMQGDGLWREQTHGTTGSGSCLPDTKRRQGTIMAWFSCHVVS